MFAVLGASGHIGSAVTEYLLKNGYKVTVVVRKREKAAAWAAQGASVAVVDVHDTQALAETLNKASRAFLLNPPANPSSNTDLEERETVQSILKALAKTHLEKIVVLSTYGAQPGSHCGDLGVLYEFEQGALQSGIPLCIVRAAYLMSNWLPSLGPAKQSGQLKTLLPVSLSVPMVAPEDVGYIAGELLAAPASETGIYSIEGPSTYSADDIARDASEELSCKIVAEQVPRSEWGAFYKSAGFSDDAASSYAAMTDIFIHQRYDRPAEPLKGKTTLARYLRGSAGSLC